MSKNHQNVVSLLKIESEAIEAAALRLETEPVEKAIALFDKCEGKVIVLGVGKSGVIAQKIAQTMTSTGTIAIFVHPSDALHGSLGIAAKGDVVIALSNSGETDEILALLPAIKNRSIPIVAIIGNLDSTLARESDVVLDASVDKEACPLNLAPTTSTTVALSIGDALAMTLMQNRGLTPAQFAENHPAGRLGKRLTIKVKDLMHESPSISPDEVLFDVVHALSKHSLGAVNIINDGGLLMGIVTDGDLRRALDDSREIDTDLKASDFMTTKPVTVAPEALAYDALELMEKRSKQISVLPVVDGNGQAIGLIRLHDIVRSGI